MAYSMNPDQTASSGLRNSLIKVFNLRYDLTLTILRTSYSSFFDSFNVTIEKSLVIYILSQGNLL